MNNVLADILSAASFNLSVQKNDRVMFPQSGRRISATNDYFLAALIFAQRAFWAATILARPAALMVFFFSMTGAAGLAAAVLEAPFNALLMD